ncbi:MAG: GNAT family N-acetyltransferase [Woeseiaceae bacterium]|nr:GNAT family N-acetyltransferase [Woeseiaceae bacterium]NIP20597.1 GNAT family N-acetyltransferase [Woeseiaceae bacterium]NIS89390.1 GNAT family N-acetyltransferase [Woeseiaceae bacterium]
MTFHIRPGASDDLNRLVEIYNYYVTETHVTFDTESFAVAERIQWFNQFAETGRYRLLVAEEGDDILGYASSTVFEPRAAYNTSVETAIYLEPEHTGSGIGFQLYGALIDELTAEKTAHRAYSGVALPNDASVALHRKLGFERVGSYHEVGYKFDKYWDVDWFEKDVSGNG